MRYFLSLGSNQRDRSHNLSQALSSLEKRGIKIINSSSLYETEPVGVHSFPWFFNQVIEVDTKFNPLALLEITKKIEQHMGRKPFRQKKPRVIDIDILLAENTVMKTENLIIPHPRLEKRNFVLIPLKEISPETIHPLLNEKIKDLLKKSDDKSVVRIVKKRISFKH